MYECTMDSLPTFNHELQKPHSDVHNKDLITVFTNWYVLMWVIRSSRMICVGHVAHMGDIRNVYISVKKT